MPDMIAPEAEGPAAEVTLRKRATCAAADVTAAESPADVSNTKSPADVPTAKSPADMSATQASAEVTSANSTASMTAATTTPRQCVGCDAGHSQRQGDGDDCDSVQHEFLHGSLPFCSR